MITRYVGLCVITLYSGSKAAAEPIQLQAHASPVRSRQQAPAEAGQLQLPGSREFEIELICFKILPGIRKHETHKKIMLENTLSKQSTRKAQKTHKLEHTSHK